MDCLSGLKKKYPEIIKDVRGVGLLIGIEFDPDKAKEVYDKFFEKKYLVSLCGGNTIRIAPPLIVKKDDTDAFISALEDILK